MKKNTFLAIISCFFMGLSALTILPSQATAGKLRILATTFPIYQITRNITQKSPNVDVQLMLSSQQGCPHDYVLTPQDMQKVAKADILVINGLGMEEFLGAPIQKANPDITVIDSSAGITETLQYGQSCDHHEHGHKNNNCKKEHHHAKNAHRHGHHDNGCEYEHHDHDEAHHAHKHHEKKEHHEQGQNCERPHHDHHNHHGHHHCCQHQGTNPHLFASPRMVARLSTSIAVGLSKADQKGAALYKQNATTYAKKMNALADEMLALGTRLKNNKIVEPHGVFDYLAHDMNLEIVAVMLAHGQQPSAAGLRHLAQTIEKKHAGAIFTEPQYPQNVGATLARETGIPVATLDPVATGPKDAPLDYYETTMRRNMKTLEQTLGIR